MPPVIPMLSIVEARMPTLPWARPVYPGEPEAMRAARVEACRAAGRTAPNPMVGAVVLDGNKGVLGAGFHPRAGEPHAEVFALRAAGDTARGETIVVTLEPCNHHGRTPACTERCIDAGVARVVVGTGDPHPKVSGRGIARLREAGVEVELLGSEAGAPARALLAPFASGVTRKRPWVIVKVATTADGATTLAPGTQSAITGPMANAVSHALRDAVGAVVVGGRTARIDDPSLTVRQPAAPADGRQPARVVVSQRLQNLENARVWAEDGATRIAMHTAANPGRVPPGVAVCAVDPAETWPDVLLRLTADFGIDAVLIEAGAAMLSSLFEAGVVDELWHWQSGAEAGPQAEHAARELLERPGLHREVRQAGRDHLVVTLHHPVPGVS